MAIGHNQAMLLPCELESQMSAEESPWPFHMKRAWTIMGPDAMESGVAPAVRVGRRHERDRDLAECGRAELLLGAEHEPVGSPPFTLLASGIPGAIGHDQLHRHQCGGACAAVLPRGGGELTGQHAS